MAFVQQFMCLMFHPYSVEFLKWNYPSSILALSIILLGISWWKLKVGQTTVQNLVRLHGCTGWPGSILVTKTNHFRFWQDKLMLRFVSHIKSNKTILNYYYETLFSTIKQFNHNKHFICIILQISLNIIEMKCNYTFTPTSRWVYIVRVWIVYYSTTTHSKLIPISYKTIADRY